MKKFIKNYYHKLKSCLVSFLEYLKLTSLYEYIEYQKDTSKSLYEVGFSKLLNCFGIILWYSLVGLVITIALTNKGFIGTWLKCSVSLYILLLVVVTIRTGKRQW